MATVALILAAYGLLLTAGYVAARRTKPVVRILLRAGCVFWAFSFVAVPVFLILAQPARPNPLADPRFVALGYVSALRGVLSIALLGHAVLIGTILLFGWNSRQYHRAEAKPDPAPLALNEPGDTSSYHGHMVALALCYLIGWFGRLWSLHSNGNLAGLLSPIAAVAAGLLVYRARQALSRPSLVWFVLALEPAWSVLHASKTPAIALLLAVLLRGTRSSALMGSRRRLLWIIVPSVVVVTFAVIQPLKGIETTKNVPRYSSSDSVLTRTWYSLAQRADGVYTMEDALAFRGRPWLPYRAYLDEVATQALPHGTVFGSKATDIGTLWDRQVKSASLPFQYSNVSIAFSPSAEGYVEAGVPGVLFFNLVFGLVFVLVTNFLASPRLPLQAASASYVFGTGLYERGLLANIENFAKALEAGLIVGAIYLIFTGLIRKNFRKGSPSVTGAEHRPQGLDPSPSRTV